MKRFATLLAAAVLAIGTIGRAPEAEARRGAGLAAAIITGAVIAGVIAANSRPAYGYSYSYAYPPRYYVPRYRYPRYSYVRYYPVRYRAPRIRSYYGPVYSYRSVYRPARVYRPVRVYRSGYGIGPRRFHSGRRWR